jgi:uncharacterized membrane protein
VHKIALKSISSESYLLQCASNYARDITIASIEFILFYSYILSLCLLLLSWRFFKASRESRAVTLTVENGARKSKDLSEKEKDSDASTLEDDEGELIMHGYAPSAFGEVAKASLYVTSVFLSLCMFVLVLDYYSAFAIFTDKGAAYMLFNDHETLSKFFVAVWHVTTFWFLGLKVIHTFSNAY